ncbi:MAG: polysaccharide biosynthesis C-terminal domain-containing protein, partial [Candidatus Micrarchaeota archaeon]|nr:polysaccharide biosynthesis C-terminal domain-containing protein [Candidatus Micrarchaeota archaeon]
TIINSFTSSFFIASGKVKKLMRISLMSVIAQVASLLLLVPNFTAVGALVALYIIGNTITFLLFVRGLRKDFEIRMEYRKLLEIFVASLVLGAIVSGLLAIPGNVLELAAGFVAIVLIYPPLLVLFRAVDKDTFDELIHLINNIPIVSSAIIHLDRYAGFFIRLLDAKS